MLGYRNLLDLMYIATCETWYAPENSDKYSADAYAGSEDTWNRFFELLDLNGGEQALSPYLAENLLGELTCRAKGRNCHYGNRTAYADWDSTVIPFFEDMPEEYPLYQNYLYIPQRQLERDPGYIETIRQMNDKLDSLYTLYRCR